MGIFNTFWSERFKIILYCTMGVILYGIYLIADTIIIIRGNRMELGIDDYVQGAMLLYIDIIMIFGNLLSLLKRS